jgi:MmyB-like transcription regulator ligand binding domain
VKLHYTATKTFHHPIAGDLELTGEALHLPGDTGLTVITYTFEPSSPTEQAVAFLASWSSREASPSATDQPTRSDRGPTPK